MREKSSLEFFKQFDSAKSFLLLCKYFLRRKVFALTSARHSFGGGARTGAARAVR